MSKKSVPSYGQSSGRHYPPNDIIGSSRKYNRLCQMIGTFNTDMITTNNVLTNLERWFRILFQLHILCMVSALYTLSVQLSDFTVWRQTWWKNWVNCAVLTGNSADLRIVLSSRLTQWTAQFTQGIPQIPQFTCRHHDGIISRHTHF
jgi:hypothetical protein